MHAHDGLRIERRQLLVAAAGAAGSLFLARLPLRADEPPPSDWRQGLSEAEYIELVQPRAEELFADRSDAGQDGYLLHLAAAAARLGEVAPVAMKPWSKVDERIHFGLSHRGSPFIIVHWRLEPNVTLPYHPHPRANVCTIALEGEALIRHYELLGAADYESSEAFLVQFTREQLLKPGRTSTLGSRRDNIHGFFAGSQGARGFDVTTIVEAGGSPTMFVDIEVAPQDAERRLHRAHWKSQS